MGDTYKAYVDTLVNDMNNSQNGGFFIVTEDSPELDGQFAAFGKVIEGMDVVDAIQKVEVEKPSTNSESGETEESTRPVKAPVISKVTVDTFGVEYGEPATQSYYDFDAIFNMFLQSAMQGSNGNSMFLE